jgi:SAM-dependent methyltransferase
MGIYTRQKRYFEKAYKTGEHGWPVERPTPFIAKRVSAWSRRGKSGRMLDIGCGEGRHTRLFARLGFQAVGMDYEPVAIQRALAIGRRESASKSRPRYIVGDVFALPFPEESFDVVVDYGCFHHVVRADTSRYMKGVASLLKERGYYFLTCFSTKFKHFPGERRSRKFIVHRGHYDRFFEKRDFQLLFGRLFEILDIEEEKDGLYVFFNLLMRKKESAR